MTHHAGSTHIDYIAVDVRILVIERWHWDINVIIKTVASENLVANNRAAAEVTRSVPPDFNLSLARTNVVGSCQITRRRASIVRRNRTRLREAIHILRLNRKLVRKSCSQTTNYKIENVGTIRSDVNWNWISVVSPVNVKDVAFYWQR